MTFKLRSHSYYLLINFCQKTKQKQKNMGSRDFCSGITIDNLRLQQFNSVNAVTHCSLCCLRLKGQGQCNRYKNTANAHKVWRDFQNQTHTLSNTFKQFLEMIIMIEVISFHLERSGMAFFLVQRWPYRSFLLVAGVRTRGGLLQKCQSHSRWIFHSISYLSLSH